MKIEKIHQSKINQIDFDTLAFGKNFTDHMFICQYKGGKWQNPEIKPYAPITLDPSASVLHYGQAIFEGMKAYKDDENKIWLFRPEENFNRLNKSAKRLQIPEFPASYFFEGLTQLLTLDHEWIKPGEGNSLYVGDVASLKQLPTEQEDLITYNGSPAISLTIMQEKGVDIPTLHATVDKEMERLSKDLPEVISDLVKCFKELFCCLLFDLSDCLMQRFLRFKDIFPLT